MNSVIAGIIAQHAEEAADLWSLRDVCISGPHFTLRDLARLDERVDAHVDGLRIAGEAAATTCTEVLSGETAGQVFALFLWALATGTPSRIQEALHIATSSPMLSRGLISALGWLPYRNAESHVKLLFAAESPALRQIGIAVAAAHRQDPGPPLKSALADEDPSVRSRGLRAVMELGLIDSLAAVRRNLTAADALCRFWAALSAALLSSDANALIVLKSVAESDVPYREKALQAAIRRMDLCSAVIWQEKLRQSPRDARVAVIGAGALGDCACMPWLFGQMSVTGLARLAGEAFTMITGADLAREHLEGNKPEGFEAGPTENTEDENVEIDPDENLPWPDPALISKWWSAHQSEFQKGIRYLLGKPITVDWMQQVLRIGKQRQRAAAALELAILQPGQPLFNVAAPGFRQQQILGLRR